MQTYKYVNPKALSVAFFGFSLALFPDYAIVCFIPLYFLTKKTAVPLIKFRIPAFISVIFLIKALYSSDPLYHIINAAYILVLAYCIFILKEQILKYKMIFSYSITAGLFVHFLLLFVLWNNFQNQFSWEFDQNIVALKDYGNFSNFEPKTNNAWFTQNLGLQGSGVFEYSIDLRASSPVEIAVWIQSEQLGEPSAPPICLVDVKWTSCLQKFRLQARESVRAVIGTFGTFKGSDLQARGGKLIVTSPPIWYEYFISNGRTKSFSFNENAFGVWMAFVGLIGFFFLQTRLQFLGIFVITLTLIFWSGSRNAFLAFSFSALFFLVSLLIPSAYFFKRFILCLYIVVGLITISLGFLLNQSNQTVSQNQNTIGIARLLTSSYDLSSRSRVQLWRLTLKQWISSPRSFLFGSGDLQKTLSSNLDIRAASNGVVKSDITHSHNLWIQTIGETGLLGLILMGCVWVFAFFDSWNKQDLQAICIFLFIFIVNLFDYLFFYSPIMIAFWMAVFGFNVGKSDESQTLINSSEVKSRGLTE